MMVTIKQLCALAVFCGAIMSIMPEGGVRRITAIGCTAALSLTLVGALRAVDAESFTLELARYRELGAELLEHSDEVRDKLNRSVIEAEYEAYICDEAARLGIAELSVKVTARWDMNGLWLPHEVRLAANCDDQSRRRLDAVIEAELGIPGERIIWDYES